MRAVREPGAASSQAPEAASRHSTAAPWLRGGGDSRWKRASGDEVERLVARVHALSEAPELRLHERRCGLLHGRGALADGLARPVRVVTPTLPSPVVRSYARGLAGLPAARPRPPIGSHLMTHVADELVDLTIIAKVKQQGGELIA